MKLLQRLSLARPVLVWLGFILLSEAIAASQTAIKPPDSPLTLDQAVDFALSNYPAVRASTERALGSKEGVSLSRTTYLPRTDLLWQSNRATRNNIFGLYLPQSVVPPISGPVLSSTSDRGVWGSMAGGLLSWCECRCRESYARARERGTVLDQARCSRRGRRCFPATRSGTTASQGCRGRRRSKTRAFHIGSYAGSGGTTTRGRCVPCRRRTGGV